MTSDKDENSHWIRRPHAGFFRGKLKKFKRRDELWTLERLFESMELNIDARYRSPSLLKNDPPDVVAEDMEGNSVGFELTEFVDQSSVASADKGGRTIRWWNLKDIIEELESIIMEKDSIDYGRSKFHEMVLVIFTDEYTIEFGKFSKDIADYEFPELSNIDKVYLLFSFDPRVGEGDPYIQLTTHTKISN